MTEDEFAALCRDQGWGDPRPVTYEPNQRPDPHAHEFDAFVLLLDGSVTIESPDGDQSLNMGDTSQVPAGRIHAEIGGPLGGQGLVATRN